MHPNNASVSSVSSSGVHRVSKVVETLFSIRFFDMDGIIREWLIQSYRIALILSILNKKSA